MWRKWFATMRTHRFYIIMEHHGYLKKHFSKQKWLSRIITKAKWKFFQWVPDDEIIRQINPVFMRAWSIWCVDITPLLHQNLGKCRKGILKTVKNSVAVRRWLDCNIFLPEIGLNTKDRRAKIGFWRVLQYVRKKERTSIKAVLPSWFILLQIYFAKLLP